MKITVKELAERLNLPYAGDGSVVIERAAELDKAGPGDLVYCADAKHRSLLEKTGASAAVVLPNEPFNRIPVLRAENPRLAFARAKELLYKPYRPELGIHPTAVVSPTAKLGKGVSVGAYCVIGDETEVGEGTVLFPHVTVYPGVKIGAGTIVHSNTALREGVRIGNRVTIHNGVVIGADGFGYLKGEDGSHVKIPQTGTVVIEDDVEVGANSTIDRAVLGETIVRRGVKIDDLVMVAHNVEVGENAILIAQAGIAGSSKVGRNTILSGQVGIADHLTVGDNVIVAAKSGVTGNIPAGTFVSGSPHLDIRVWRKFWAIAPQIYDIVKDYKRLKTRVEELEKSIKR